MKKIFSILLICLFSANSNAQVFGDESLKWSQPELHQFWKKRINSFLDRGITPIIDLESTIDSFQSNQLTDDSVIKKMDDLGIALIAFDDNKMGQILSGKTYSWGNHMNKHVNKYPDRFIPTTNAGVSTALLNQLEKEVRSGNYSIMGEFEFRHYLSIGECQSGKLHRESRIHINSDLGERLFKLSSDTGMAFLIHNEPEDQELDALIEMLEKYPKAKVIQSHFGQIRHPDKQTKFNADFVRLLFEKYPNLYFDISVGKPGRRYECQGYSVLDTVIWQVSNNEQIDKLKPEYLKLFNDYSDRFVSGLDYGGGGSSLKNFWEDRVNNIQLIIRDLSESAKLNISYKNSWKLLTGSDF